MRPPFSDAIILLGLAVVAFVIPVAAGVGAVNLFSAIGHFGLMTLRVLVWG